MAEESRRLGGAALRKSVYRGMQFGWVIPGQRRIRWNGAGRLGKFGKAGSCRSRWKLRLVGEAAAEFAVGRWFGMRLRDRGDRSMVLDNRFRDNSLHGH